MILVAIDVVCLVGALHVALTSARQIGDCVAPIAACVVWTSVASWWAVLLHRDLARDRRPACCASPRIVKVLNVGAPGWFCQSCHTMGGLASWVGLVYFDGWLVCYTGSYWRALWRFLFGRPR